MSKTKWTPNQEQAIEARGMQVLVSAAAGSGKTAVLTERVKNIVTDIENPCHISEVLVVTFTRAAAGEMKDRIYKAINSACVGNPDADYLQEQLTCLPLADICTMDSFCSKVVKDNFTKAGVSLDFTLLDEKELDEMTAAALDNVLDKLYNEGSEGFMKLSSMLVSERNDDKLTDVIKELYRYSRSYPSPKHWLDSLQDAFSDEKEPNNTPWADVIYKHIRLFADCYYKRFMRVIATLEESGGFAPAYVERFSETARRLLDLISCVDSRNWDGMVTLIREGILFAPAARNSKVDGYVKDIANDAFNAFKKELEKIEELTLPLADEHKQDCRILYPMVEKLCEAVKLLEATLDEMKRERNAYSFDDILHKCINLLVEFNGDEWHRTAVADNLRLKYKEIFIDEYQDTNLAQNIIFEAISNDCRNLYCVGDVKQSIYKFRLASPQLFMKLRRELPEYDKLLHPSQITLDRNFRSRQGITEVTNHIFNTLMSEAVGEIDYNEKEKLVYGADYDQKPTPDVELMCLDYSECNSADALNQESEQVAQYIKRLLSSGIKVKTKTGEKALESSDICILLRSMKNKADVFAKALNDVGISANTVSDGDTSLSKEIQLLISFIRVVNNPLMDIPLISVLLSPVFGFSLDEIAEIRMIDRNVELYCCLEKYAESSQKAGAFLKKLQLYRNISASYPINEFVKFIVKDTDISNIYSATDEGASRSANIRGFVEFAEGFTGSGRTGLGAFVRYIDIAVNEKKLRAYGGTVSPEGVQIMSIHKSKGLEFPYVIVASCSSEFNKSDVNKPLKISRETGIGLKIRDDERFTTYNTLSSVAAEKDILYGGASEELRVLYVAATRAREHLTFVCSFKSRDGLKKSIRLNNHFSIDSEGKLHPYAVFKAKSMSEWLLTCFSQHVDGEIVCSLSEIKIPKSNISTYRMDVSPHVDYVVEAIEDQEEQAPVEFGVLESLGEKSAFKYKYDCTGILAKRTASSTERHLDDRKYFAKRKPKFLGDSITGAERGTAIHKFLELCNFLSAFENLSKEKERLLELGKMTEEELSVIDEKTVSVFFKSDVIKRLLNSQKVFKEYKFSFLKKAGELYEGLSADVADEDIVVQGMLDLAFIENGEAVLIDYKTDNITNAEDFKAIYAPQLRIYSEALKECTGCTVKEKYIYSFKLKQFIEI